MNSKKLSKRKFDKIALSECARIYKEAFRLLWTNKDNRPLDWHLHIEFMEACRQNFSFHTWLQRMKDPQPSRCWSFNQWTTFWKCIGYR
jgi:hypothetical protein